MTHHNVSSRNTLFPIFIFLIVTLLHSCAWNNEEELYPENKPCDTVDVKYSTHIAPLLQLKCNACHDGSSSGNDIVTDNYNDLKSAINSGRFWGSVNHDTGFKPMPKSQSKLDDCTISIIEKWIKEGSPNN